MKATLAELAILVNGTFSGDGTMEITGAAPTHTAGPSEITFIGNTGKLDYLAKSEAGAVVAPKDFKYDGKAIIHVEKVLPAFEQIVKWFVPPREQPERRVSEQASIARSAQIGENVRVDPFVVIGEDSIIGENCTIHSGVRIMAGAQIGKDTELFPNVVLYENTVIGDRCIIHANASLGAYGFGYDSSSGRHILSAQLGNVVVGDDVEIGACSTIDRATYGSTIIGEGTKIDNLVMIAHNCRIGKYNMICAHSGVAGSTTTGDYVVMAGRVGIRDHVHIGAGAVLGAMAGVMANIPDGGRFVGIPATPEKEQLRMQVAFARLPEMRRELINMKKQLKELTDKDNNNS